MFQSPLSLSLILHFYWYVSSWSYKKWKVTDVYVGGIETKTIVLQKNVCNLPQSVWILVTNTEMEKQIGVRVI